MTVERSLRMIAGLFVTSSAVLASCWSPYWLLSTIFVGLNLFQSALTGWCPAMLVLRKVKISDGVCCTCGSAEHVQ